LEYIEEVKRDSIITACIVLSRNSIVGGNVNVTQALQTTKMDKRKLFDKILVLMVQKCTKSLDYTKANEVLSSENVTELYHPHETYININREEMEIKPISFDKEENKLLDIIYVWLNNVN
jgi:hypothetical protein